MASRQEAGPVSVERCSAEGLTALREGRIDEARAWAARCDATAKGASDFRCISLHGAIAAMVGDFKTAALHYQRAAEMGAEASVARQWSESLSADGDSDQAAAVLERALRYSPEDADLLLDLGYARLINGDARGAREALERAAKLRPEDRAIGLALAQACEALGDPARAAKALAAVAGDSPTPRLAHDLARLHLRLGWYSEADASFRSLAAVDPDHALFAQHGRIWCRIRKGDWRGALEAALTATRLDRLEFTTALLAYAKARLFTRVSDAEKQEAELEERFLAELREHDSLHAIEESASPADVDQGVGRV